MQSKFHVSVLFLAVNNHLG